MNAKKTRLRAWARLTCKNAVIFGAIVGMLSTVGSTAIAQTRVAYVVQSDRGGMIGQRSKEIRGLRATGQPVELRGTCLSACTMYLSLPNACVSSNATLGFHGPTRNGQRLSAREFDHWSQVMASNYREPLRSWYMTEGRHRISGYYRFSGAQLIQMGYRQC